MAQVSTYTKILLSGKISQDLRSYLSGASQGPDCMGFEEPRLTELTLYCTDGIAFPSHKQRYWSHKS